jgi:hypothetical protein
LILDTTAITATESFTALYWGVAQGAQLQNINITMPYSSNGEGHTGIQLGRGSTLALADVYIEAGQNGIWHDGHQQALYKNIYFYQNTIGMLISGGDTISLLSPTFDTCGTGVSNTGGDPWIALIDATSINSGVTFTTTGYPSFLIENLNKDTTSDVADGPNGVLYGDADGHVDTFTVANTVGADPIYGPITTTNTRPASLAPSGRYPALPAPNYASTTVSGFINVKDSTQNGGYTVLGDLTIDESGTLNAVLEYAVAQDKIAYFPFGNYRVDSTLLIPAGSRIVGEAWSTISGYGDYFTDSSNPKPVVAIGNSGDVGIAQIQDMRFTVAQVLPGAIIVQVNMRGNDPGDVAIWNSLVTVGGTLGASDIADTCTNPAAECQAAFIGVQIAATGSAYIENTWIWVADHFTEGSGGTSIGAKGGMLVQSTYGSWLHGVGVEHWWLYQLNLWEPSGVVVTLLQSETNYDQGDNTEQVVPAPWTASTSTWGDPDYSWCSGSDTRCRMGLSNYINGGEDVYTYASASWAFFSGPGYLPCATGTDTCQDYIHWIEANPTNLNAFGLCSKDTWAALRLADNTDIVTADGFTGSWSGDVGRYTV